MTTSFFIGSLKSFNEIIQCLDKSLKIRELPQKDEFNLAEAASRAQAAEKVIKHHFVNITISDSPRGVDQMGDQIRL